MQHIKVDKSSICSFFIFKHRMPCTEYWTTRYMYMYCKYLFLCCSCFSALWASVKGLNSGQRASNCLTNSTIAVVCDMSPRACQACLLNRAELSLICWWDKVKSIDLKNIINSYSNEKTFFLFFHYSSSLFKFGLRLKNIIWFSLIFPPSFMYGTCIIMYVNWPLKHKGHQGKLCNLEF